VGRFGRLDCATETLREAQRFRTSMQVDRTGKCDFEGVARQTLWKAMEAERWLAAVAAPGRNRNRNRDRGLLSKPEKRGLIQRAVEWGETVCVGMGDVVDCV